MNVFTLSIAQPRFSSRPGNFSVNVGEEIRTKTPCVAEGNPVPIVSWRDVPLGSASGSNPVLGTESSSGVKQYSCVATNAVGQSITEFYVFVQGTIYKILVTIHGTESMPVTADLL